MKTPRLNLLINRSTPGQWLAMPAKFGMNVYAPVGPADRVLIAQLAETSTQADALIREPYDARRIVISANRLPQAVRALVEAESVLEACAMVLHPKGERATLNAAIENVRQAILDIENDCPPTNGQV